MTLRTFATLFSGGEGVGVGLRAAGLSHAWGVEYDAAIAAVAADNGFPLIVDDVRRVDYAALPGVDWLHASPVCTRASVANTGAGESDEDISMAAAVVRALKARRPQVFTLENVWQYRTFASFRLICDALGHMGYFWTYDHINAADFGVPQTRRRLVLRASRGLLPMLPEPVRWVGWYEAIADLIPTLPESKLAPWQLARLPGELRESVLVETQNTARDATVRMVGEPSSTLSGSIASRPSQQLAVLVNGTNAGRELTTLRCTESAFTVHGEVHKGMPRAWLGARCVAMTPRALARFQSFPDSYRLPERRALAAKVIGNAVPPLMMQRLAEQLMEVHA